MFHALSFPIALVVLTVLAGLGCGIPDSNANGPAEPPPAGPTAGDTAPAAPTPGASADSVPTTTADDPPAVLASDEPYLGRTLDAWTADLRDADDSTRAAAADAVAQYGPNAAPAVPALVALLKSPGDLSFVPALEAIAAIGPKAGAAVDPLVELLGHEDGRFRAVAANTLARLGPAAGKAVPALIAAADGDSDTEADRLSARYVVQTLGKYDVKSVFAAVRDDRLSTSDLSEVIDTLGPDDARAVAGLAAELGRADGDLETYALRGLGRIGPNAASALPAVRKLAGHRSAFVRESAAEAIAAIGGPTAEEAGAGPPDADVAAVIGAELSGYETFGYKDVVLGTPFDELAAEKQLKPARPSEPWAFSSKSNNEGFVFGADKKLVCYTRTYSGGVDDYLDQLIEVFGKTNRKPDQTVSTNPTAVTRRVTLAYTFPKVLVRVVFVRVARQNAFGGPPVVEEITHVVVLDRAWACDQLATNARGKRAAVAWVRAAGEAAVAGKLTPDTLPALAGATGRETAGVPLVHFYAPASEDASPDAGAVRPPRPIALVGKTSRPGSGIRGPVTHVEFSFARYAPVAAPNVFRQDEPRKGAVFAPDRNTGLSHTPFQDVITDLNVAITRTVFPPTGEIEFVRPASGDPYYEWRTEDGWRVLCGTNDGLTVEWIGKKKL